MTTNTDYLALITATIDTQYSLARIELFRPLEHLDRYHGIKASEMGHDCKPTFACHRVEDRPTAVRKIAADVAEIAARAGASTSEVVHYINEARCTCATNQKYDAVYRSSIRVSITWNGRTLTREYVLPEEGKSMKVTVTAVKP
jgi:hypothetical protein